jgi:hypothetical protein
MLMPRFIEPFSAFVSWSWALIAGGQIYAFLILGLHHHHCRLSLRVIADDRPSGCGNRNIKSCLPAPKWQLEQLQGSFAMACGTQVEELQNELAKRISKTDPLGCGGTG